MVKEAGIAVVCAGGISGTCYVIFKPANPKNIQELIVKDIEDGQVYGIPITLLEESDQTSWWRNAYYKHLFESLESDLEEDKKFSPINGDNESKKIEDLKRQCVELLNRELKGDESDTKGVEKAKLWCVTFETINSKLSNKEQDKTVGNTEWLKKYNLMSSDGNLYKNILSEALSTFSESTDETKKVEAVQWVCYIATFAGSDKVKNRIYSETNAESAYCIFKNSAVGG